MRRLADVLRSRWSRSRFATDARANVTVMFALTMPALLLGAGATVDFSNAASARTRLQAALDSAVLGGAMKFGGERDEEAMALFRSHRNEPSITVAAPSFVSDPDGVLRGAVSAQVPTHVMAAFGQPTMTVHARAAAHPPIKDQSCILTFGKSMGTNADSMTYNGASNVNLTGCTLQSNTSMTCNGHNGSATKSLAVGSAGSCNNPVDRSPPIPDIYAGLASNIDRRCGASSFNVTWSPTQTPNGAKMITTIRGSVTEYHVCGNLTISGAHEINTSGGDALLVVENGKLTISKDADVTMTRMAVIMTGDPTASHAIAFPQGNGQSASLSIAPPTMNGNPFRGIAIYQDPALTANVDLSWGPGATLHVDGVIYLPNADFTMSGVATSLGSNCTKLVTDTLTVNGAVTFAQNDAGCADIGLKQYQTAARLIL